MSCLVETMDRIRTERIARRSIPSELCKLSSSKNSPSSENHEEKENSLTDIPRISRSIDEIDRLLRALKKNEPTNDNKFFRLSIIAYEIGDLHRSVIYAERFKSDEKIRIGYLAHGKLALADALTQLYLLCETMKWDFHELRKLGAEHLKERQEDFKRQNWNDVK